MASKAEIIKVQQLGSQIGWPVTIDGIKGPQTNELVANFKIGYLFTRLPVNTFIDDNLIDLMDECWRNNGKASPNFAFREFASKGNGWIKVNWYSLYQLEMVRKYKGGKPLPIISAYRDYLHNLRVRGASDSRHLYGDAFDIPASYGLLYWEAEQLGFTGIGIQDDGTGRATHIDTRPGSIVHWYYFWSPSTGLITSTTRRNPLPPRGGPITVEPIDLTDPFPDPIEPPPIILIPDPDVAEVQRLLKELGQDVEIHGFWTTKDTEALNNIRNFFIKDEEIKKKYHSGNTPTAKDIDLLRYLLALNRNFFTLDVSNHQGPIDKAQIDKWAEDDVGGLCVKISGGNYFNDKYGIKTATLAYNKWGWVWVYHMLGDRVHDGRMVWPNDFSVAGEVRKAIERFNLLPEDVQKNARWILDSETYPPANINLQKVSRDICDGVQQAIQRPIGTYASTSFFHRYYSPSYFKDNDIAWVAQWQDRPLHEKVLWNGEVKWLWHQYTNSAKSGGMMPLDGNKAKGI